MRKFRFRHLGVVLGAFALATILWGCSNLAPTGVSSNDPSLQPAGSNTPAASSTDSDTNKWW